MHDSWDGPVREYLEEHVRLEWVKRAFEPLWGELISDMQFALMYDLVGDEFVRNDEPVHDAFVSPFWDDDSCGVNITIAGYNTLLRVSKGVIMEPRALRKPLAQLCDDFCQTCHVGNMAPIRCLGTFVDVHEGQMIAQYASMPQWPRCPHADTIARQQWRTIRCVLARVSWEDENRFSPDWELFAQMHLRYQCDRAFVLIMCEWMRDSGYVASLPREIWRMIRKMVSTRGHIQHRYDTLNRNAINDWSYLYPLKIEWV